MPYAPGGDNRNRRRRKEEEEEQSFSVMTSMVTAIIHEVSKS
jgi:hypothetical protein